MKIRTTVAVTTIAAGLLALTGCSAGPVEYFGDTHSIFGSITIDGDKATFQKFACKGQKPDPGKRSEGTLSSDKKSIDWGDAGYMVGVTTDIATEGDKLTLSVNGGSIVFYKVESAKAKELMDHAQGNC